MSRGPREHFGSGQLAFDRTKAVFINCPYDAEFEPTFDAIVFATACCGFMPRSAVESGTKAESRMERIVQPIFSSKYSIHDLSRCRGEGSELLARFNMPLELGIAMARRYMTPKKTRHDWLLLVPEGHLYLKFASDLAAFDPICYDGKPESVVPGVMGWLVTRPEASETPSPEAVLAELPRFQAEKARLQKEWRGKLPWADLVLTAIRMSKAIL
jgi:hypothetical protein